MKRLHELCSLPPELDDRVRRGNAWQRPQRQREQDLRHNIVTLSRRWQEQDGLSGPQTAACLRLSPRTLRQWCGEDHTGPGPGLGRPVQRASRPERRGVLELLVEHGLGLGVPTLCACFPTMRRAELADLLCRARCVARRRYHDSPRVLTWTRPGAVWAIDFSQAEAAIDGRYPHLLAVRDLASGRQLLALPLDCATAANAVPALASLFERHGAPLILKADNGSPFAADATLDLLSQYHVQMLFSPPYWPQYNGAIEAGIGSLKTRIEQHAARHGRPGQWTWDDVAWAQSEANATARPQGLSGPTPDQAWQTRQPITLEERLLLHASVARYVAEVRAQDGWPTLGPLPTMDQRAVDRQAIQRALVEHGYLLFKRRRIPLPIETRKTANIL